MSIQTATKRSPHHPSPCEIPVVATLPIHLKDDRTGVYKWTNMVNGKIYVGSASKAIGNRRWWHLQALRLNRHENSHFQRAWNKYGEESFEFSVLEVCAPDHCIEREQHWMDLLEVINPDKGYNKAPIAGSNRGTKRTEKEKKASSKRMKKLWQDPEFRVRMSPRLSEAQKISQNRPEVREIHSKASKENWQKPEYREKVLKAVKAGNAKPGVQERRKASAAAAQKRPEVQKKRSASLKASWATMSQKARKKRLAALKSYSSDPALLAERVTKAQEAVRNRTPERQAQISKTKKEALTPKVRRRLSKQMKEIRKDPKRKAKHVAWLKQSWEDPVIRAKRQAGIKAAWTRRKAREMEQKGGTK